MKLKEQKKLGTLYFVLGAVLAIAGYFIKNSWLASFGGGFLLLAVGMLCFLLMKWGFGTVLPWAFGTAWSAVCRAAEWICDKVRQIFGKGGAEE